MSYVYNGDQFAHTFSLSCCFYEFDHNDERDNDGK